MTRPTRIATALTLGLLLGCPSDPVDTSDPGTDSGSDTGSDAGSDTSTGSDSGSDTATPLWADVQGVWDITLTVPVGADVFVETDRWVLAQTDDSYEVVFGSARGVTGSVTLDTISFSGALFGNAPLTGSGTIDGDSIDATLDVIHPDTGEHLTGTLAMSRTSTDPTVPTAPAPAANITVDGDPADWASVSPQLIDDVGDSWTGAPSGADIEWLKFAKDASGNQLYLLIKVADGPITPANQLDYRVQFLGQDWTEVTEQLVDIYSADGSTWSLQQRTDTLTGGSTGHVDMPGNLAVAGSYIEVGFTRAGLGCEGAGDRFDKLMVDITLRPNMGGDPSQEDTATLWGLLVY